MGKNLKEKKQSQSKKKRKLALGRGLDALIPVSESVHGDESGFFECEIDQIRPNPYQPRSHFSDVELAELARSNILRRFPETQVWITDTSPAIGSHAGPGGLAVAVLDAGSIEERILKEEAA